MYSIDRIKLTNVMAHKDSEFVVHNNKAIMIYGINEVDQGQKSNGSGKSAILESISIALLGSVLRKDVTIAELISYGQNSMSVELHLSDSNGESIVIDRTIFANTKPSQIKIKLNGKLIDDLTSVREADKFILQTLQISRDDLLNYFLLSKEKYTSFFQMSDSGKKEMIGRFSQSNLIDPVYDIIASKSEQIQQEIDQNKKEYDRIDGKIQAYQEQIDEFDIKELERRRKVKLDRCSDNINDYRQQIRQATSQIESLDVQIKDTEHHISQHSKVSQYDDKIKNLQKQVEDKTSQGQDVSEELIELRQLKGQVVKALASAVQCPKCSHKFSVEDDEINVVKAEQSKQEIDDAISDVQQEIKQRDDQIKQLNANIRSYQQQINQSNHQLNKLNSSINGLKSQKSSYQNKINNCKSSIKSVEQQMHEIKQYEIQDPTKQLQLKIQQSGQQLTQVQNQMNALEKQLYDNKQWDGIITKFKTHLANKTIGVIEAYCNEYLQRMGSDLTIRLEGYKTTKQGKIRENITTFVLRNGIDQGGFGKFSSGERAKIQVAMILGLQQLINTNTDSGGLNLCFFDEVIESLDSEGIHGIMKALNTLNQTVIVVTHGTFDKNYPHICTVTKTRNASEIQYK